MHIGVLDSSKLPPGFVTGDGDMERTIVRGCGMSSTPESGVLVILACVTLSSDCSVADLATSASAMVLGV